MEDLDSKNNFDLNYIYQIYLNGYGGCSILNTWTLADKLEFSHGGTLHIVLASNKKQTNHGVQINKIIKKKL